MAVKYFYPTKLSEREEQVILLRAEGMQGKEIAELLGIALGTVRATQFHAVKKLGVKSMIAAAKLIKTERFRLAHNV